MLPSLSDKGIKGTRRVLKPVGAILTGSGFYSIRGTLWVLKGRDSNYNHSPKKSFKGY